MLVYLNNRSSRAGSANENYARELLELHTLGRGAYLNTLYDRWRDVPGATEGRPQGYIDQDVYEAARAFTGWTIADGTGLGGGMALPATGAFTYVEAWHDGYQKRVLGHEFDPFQAPMADGRKVLDLVADHPATAWNVCTRSRAAWWPTAHRRASSGPRCRSGSRTAASRTRSLGSCAPLPCPGSSRKPGAGR